MRFWLADRNARVRRDGQSKGQTNEEPSTDKTKSTHRPTSASQTRASSKSWVG